MMSDVPGEDKNILQRTDSGSTYRTGTMPKVSMRVVIFKNEEMS